MNLGGDVVHSEGSTGGSMSKLDIVGTAIVVGGPSINSKSAAKPL